jgi:gamma-glutamylputrescine oxidase
MQDNYSYWEHTSFLSGYDVMIIGSGIVGLTAAWNLKQKQASLKVGILEAGFLPSGASTKNAGFACFGSVSETLDELESSTEEEVMQVVEMRWKGLQKLKSLLGEKAIDYKQFGGYEIFKTADRQLSESCTENLSYINKLFKQVTGLTDIYAVTNEKIAEFGFSDIKTIISNQAEAQIDTGKMMQALTSIVQGLGVSIFNSCNLLSLEKDAEEQLLITSQGNFTAKKVIMASNAFIGSFYPGLNVIPGRGQVLVTKPVNNLKISGTFHYDKGYYYFRNIHSRILLGGGRNIDFKAEETTAAGITDCVQSKLEELLYETIIPDQRPEIEFRWSGVMAFGDSVKPIIERIDPNIFCAVRCNGMGVAMGSLSGEQVADLVLKEL